MPFLKISKEQSPAYLFQLIPEIRPPILREVFRIVKSLFSRQKQTFSKVLSFLQLYRSGINLMLIFVTRLLGMFLRELY